KESDVDRVGIIRSIILVANGDPNSSWRYLERDVNVTTISGAGRVYVNAALDRFNFRVLFEGNCGHTVRCPTPEQTTDESHNNDVCWCQRSLHIVLRWL